MKTLRKLLLVACAAFFFTSCEETYNNKLFWPGELSQEYGSYIKPSTLDLTYSGEKLIGKSVSFITEDSKKGTLTLNDVIPGEKETSFRVELLEKEDNYTFNSGEKILQNMQMIADILHNHAAKPMDEQLSAQRTDTRQRKRRRT